MLGMDGRANRWVAVAGLLLLASCGSAERQLAAGGEGEPVAPRAAAALDVRWCNDVRPRGVVEGPLSDDAEVAEAQQWRADQGLRSDHAWVEEVPSVPTTTPEAGAFAHPLTDEEVAGLFARNEQTAPVEVVNGYAEGFPETFAGTWLDNVAGGVLTVAFTEDVDERRAELEALLAPGTDLAVVRAERSAAELHAVKDRIDASGLMGTVVDGHGIRTDVQLVSVLLRVVDEESVAALRDAVGEESMAAVCVEGRTPDELVPEGPQPPGGAGWRLLGEGTSGPTYVTLVAAEPEAYQALWDEAGIEAPLPEVDLEHEIVVLFGPAVSGSCPQIRLDDVVIDVKDRLVHAQLSHPGSPAACTDDANPHPFVVAIEREALPPSPFTVQLHEEVVCKGCEGVEPDEVTEVDLGPS